MENIAVIVFCVLAVPFAIGWFIGYLHRGSVERGKWKRGEYPLPAQRTSPTSVEAPSRSEIIRDYLHRPDVVDVVGQERLGVLIAQVVSPRPTPTVVDAEPLRVPSETAEVPTHATTAASDAPVPTPVIIAAPSTTPSPASLPLPREDHGREAARLDPAVLLLYLGALLIVVAGIIFASYAWGTLNPWQKMGLLVAGTAAFVGAGYGLRNLGRIAQAAETFLAIGALLIPANVIAAYAVFQGEITNPAIPLCIGAAVIAIVYTAFSIDPGGFLYRVGAPIAAFVAIGAVPAALGFEHTWAAAALLAVFGLVPSLGGRLRHLDDVWRPVGWVGCGLATLWMLGEGLVDYADGFDGLPWTVAVTSTILTLVLVRRWRATDDDTWAIGASVSGTFALGTAMISTHVEDDRAWAGVATGIAVAFVLLADRLRGDRSRSRLATVLLIESLLAFIFAATVILDGDPGNGTIAAVFAAPMIAYAWAAFRRHERWWLLVSAIASVGAVFPLLGSLFPDANDTMTAPLIISGYVAMLAAAALITSIAAVRRGMWTAFALPVWIWAGIMAAVTIAVQVAAIVDEDTAVEPRLALAAALFGLLALVAAWSMHIVAIRGIYGGFAIAGVIALAWWPELQMEDRFPLVLLLTVLVAIPSIPAIATRIRSFTPLGNPQPPLEFAAFGITAIGSLVAIVGGSIAHVTEPDRTDTPGFWWTWVTALAIFFAMAVIGVATGIRGTPLPWNLGRWLPEWTLVWTLYAAFFAATLATRDVQILTWLGLGIAAIMAIAPVSPAEHLWIATLRERARTAGLALGILAIIVNLQATSDRYDDRDLGQTIIYAAIALGLIVAAIRPNQRFLLYAGMTAAAIAIGFGLRWTDASFATTALTLMIATWLLSTTLLALPESRRWQCDTWATAAGIAAIVAIPLAFASQPDESPFEQTVIVLSLANSGLLFAIEGRRRSLPLLLYLGSAFGMLAVFTTLFLRDIDDVHAYSLPLAAYALVLAWLRRRVATAHDLLATIGALALVGPPIVFALREQSFTWLVMTLIEAVALVVGGAVARLRMAIAIGIVAVTLIVLRLLVDAANALPSWATLLVLGLALLAVGTVWITLRDDIRERSDTLRERWKRLA